MIKEVARSRYDIVDYVMHPFPTKAFANRVWSYEQQVYINSDKMVNRAYPGAPTIHSARPLALLDQILAHLHTKFGTRTTVSRRLKEMHHLRSFGMDNLPKLSQEDMVRLVRPQVRTWRI
jgi:hypothetical protein